MAGSHAKSLSQSLAAEQLAAHCPLAGSHTSGAAQSLLEEQFAAVVQRRVGPQLSPSAQSWAAEQATVQMWFTASHANFEFGQSLAASQVFAHCLLKASQANPSLQSLVFAQSAFFVHWRLTGPQLLPSTQSLAEEQVVVQT